MFSPFFSECPIFAAILSLAGRVSIFVMPVPRYPATTPVQVTVQATYPDGISKTLADFGGHGSSHADRLRRARRRPRHRAGAGEEPGKPGAAQLSSTVMQQGVSVQKKSSTIMMLLTVTGKGGRYSAGYVANYASVYVLDALKRVPGAGQAQIMRVADQAMRIGLNPDRMAWRRITTGDIANANAINSQNALFGVGQIGQEPTADALERSFPVATQSPFANPRQYEKIMLRANQDDSVIGRVATSRALKSAGASTSSNPDHPPNDDRHRHRRSQRRAGGGVAHLDARATVSTACPWRQWRAPALARAGFRGVAA